MKSTFFASPEGFRNWLTLNHNRPTKILLRVYKRGSGKASLTIEEAQIQALCFGWIDGKLNKTGVDSFVIRFTPRRRGSLWSEVNIKRVKELIKQGLMQPAGRKAFEERDVEKTGFYSYEQRSKGLSEEFETQFQRNKKAWKFFTAQPPGYKRTITFWVMSAKREDTKQKRLVRLIDESAKEKSIYFFGPFGKKRKSPH